MSKNLDDISVGELIDLLKQKSHKENPKDLDILKENNILKVKVNCSDCKKPFYTEFKLDGHNCPECHKKFTDKIEAEVKEQVKNGSPEDWLMALVKVVKEDIKNDK